MLPNNIDPEFFDYLLGLNAKGVKVSALKEGSVVFPRVPMITVEGPLAVCQIFETIFLNLVSFASLVTTNASRLRYVSSSTTFNYMQCVGESLIRGIGEPFKKPKNFL